MKNGFFVLYNKHGKVSRVVPSNFPVERLIYRLDNRRVEFVAQTDSLEASEIEFLDLGDLKGSAKDGATLLEGPWGRVRYEGHVSSTEKDLEPRKDDDKKDTVFFMKWSAAAMTGLLAVTVGLGYLLKPDEKLEPQTVTVFQQRPSEPQRVVKMSEEKILRQNTRQAKVSNQTRPKAVSEQKTKRVATDKTYSRSGNELKNMGALSAFGGMNRQSNGRGGLGSTASKSSGYGFDSSRAAGGHSRGMLGKGLLQSGIGSGGSVQGYGGYGTKGKGSGEAAFGDVGMAGRSGGYYLPLSEEAKIVGGLDRDQINAVVRRNLGQVIYCYEQGLQTSPSLSGRVTVNFQIAPNGLVSVANVGQSSLRSARVENCIVGKLRNWKFPRPEGNVSVKVTYPFDLKRLNQG